MKVNIISILLQSSRFILKIIRNRQLGKLNILRGWAATFGILRHYSKFRIFLSGGATTLKNRSRWNRRLSSDLHHPHSHQDQRWSSTSPPPYTYPAISKKKLCIVSFFSRWGNNYVFFAVSPWSDPRTTCAFCDDRPDILYVCLSRPRGCVPSFWYFLNVE